LKSLENRQWFNLFTLAITVVLMYAMWRASSLPLTWMSACIFMFSVFGLGIGVNKILALAFIRIDPVLAPPAGMQRLTCRSSGPRCDR
jgi:hypothetical protein